MHTQDQPACICGILDKNKINIKKYFYNNCLLNYLNGEKDLDRNPRETSVSLKIPDQKRSG